MPSLFATRNDAGSNSGEGEISTKEDSSCRVVENTLLDGIGQTVDGLKKRCAGKVEELGKYGQKNGRRGNVSWGRPDRC